jgi:DcuC family C4-dicarboxylate transporter
LPLLVASGLSPARAGTVLLLGSSVGGELLNAGAPEVAAIAQAAGVTSVTVITRMTLPALLVGGTAALVFWAGTIRPEGQPKVAAPRSEPDPVSSGSTDRLEGDVPAGFAGAELISGPERLNAFEESQAKRINLVKAAIPLLPVLMLMVDARAHVFPRPADPAAWKEWMPIGYAMLIGTGLAMLTAPSQLSRSTAAFFQGQGFAYAYIISLIVAALTFVEGLKQSGLMGLAVAGLTGRSALAVPVAVIVPGGLALLTGSGIAPSLTFIEAFLPHARSWGLDPVGLGLVASQAAAIGRTFSPAAAVVMVSSMLAGVPPVTLLARAARPLLAAWLVLLILGFWLVR